MKRYKITYIRSPIHLVYTVYPMVLTHKNGTNNDTVTQWYTYKHIFLVKIWEDIIREIDSYPDTS